jgi:hypothetical protein
VGLVVPELGSLRVQEFKLVPVLLHGEAHWCRRSGYGYWASRAEVLVFLWRRVDGAGRTPWRVSTEVDAGSMAEVMLVLVGAGDG